MAVLLSDTVWEGTSLDMPTTPGEDGQFFKQLDTGESYIHRNGVWTFINLGLSFIKATKSGVATTDVNGQAHISFNTPFITPLDYHVALSCSDSGDLVVAYKSNLAATGFDITTRDKNGHTVRGIEVSWLATRDYNP